MVLAGFHSEDIKAKTSMTMGSSTNVTSVSYTSYIELMLFYPLAGIYPMLLGSRLMLV